MLHKCSADMASAVAPIGCCLNTHPAQQRERIIAPHNTIICKGASASAGQVYPDLHKPMLQKQTPLAPRFSACRQECLFSCSVQQPHQFISTHGLSLAHSLCWALHGHERQACPEQASHKEAYMKNLNKAQTSHKTKLNKRRSCSTVGATTKGHAGIQRAKAPLVCSPCGVWLPQALQPQQWIAASQTLPPSKSPPSPPPLHRHT